MVRSNPKSISLQEKEHTGVSLQLNEHDFTESLVMLRLCHGSNSNSKGGAMAGDHNLGKEALQLTQLHGQFGHKYTVLT